MPLLTSCALPCAQLLFSVGWRQGHTVKDFLRRLKARYARETNDGDGMIDADDFDWAALGKSVAWHFRTAPSVYCMLGPLDARAKTRAQQQRAPRQRLADEVRPVDVQVSVCLLRLTSG